MIRIKLSARQLWAYFPVASFFSLAFVVALAGCDAGGPITVVSDYGPGIKFSGLGSTYKWMPENASHSTGAKEMHELIRASADKHLTEKGFSQSPDGAVDFLLGYRIARREKTDADLAPHGEVIDEGSLILDVLESTPNPESGKGHRRIWRGIARARILDSDTPEKRQKRLETAMRELMKEFPSKAGV